MRLFHGLTIAAAVAVLAPTVGAQMQDMAKAVADGGIKVAGWQGVVDANEAKAGMTVNSAKFVAEGKGFHVTTGPAITYWNPANKAMGDYTVKATFNEPHYMNLNDHPHPYGIVIGGNDLGTENMSLIYCNAYGNGTFIVRGFGPAPFSVSPRRAEANEAINKAAGKDAPVTQEIALSVKGDKIECAVNGKVVGSYDKAAVVGAGKLKSTDGTYGLRFGHNTEAIVTGLTMTKG
jgi:hypothetical protein